jgi:lipid II:glycine glycyltransferase (peptidoglycan interpeptide bridge formation enzyme)
MKVAPIPETITPEAYNRNAHHPLQSWQWGVAREKMGTQIHRFGVFEDTALQTPYLMTLHPIPGTGFIIGYVPRSPLPTPEVLTYTRKFAEKHNCIFIKWEPDVAKSRSVEEELTRISKSAQLVRSAHPLFPDWTMTLDLTPSEEELMKAMKSKTRYNIRLASKKGVQVTERSNEEGFRTFSDLYFATTKRQQYHGHTPQYHATVWDTMKEGIAHILIASYQDTPLAAYELFLFKDRLFYPYGGSSTAHRNLMAPNLLMWEAIRFGKAQGATSFDMWGATHPDYTGSDPYAGFTRFKEGYNAQHLEMIGSWDQVCKPLLYPVYSALHTLRSWYLRMNG